MSINLIQVGMLLASYLVGSIPFGLILTLAAGKGDVRKIGSGNIGATNVLRTGSKALALLTLFFDFFKGWCVVFFIKNNGLSTPLGEGFESLASWAAIAVVLGHMFPVWLQFKGGKGVATYAGVLMALSAPLGAQAFLGWIAFLVMFGYSSLAALLTAALVPVSVWLWQYEGLLGITLTLTLLVWIKHWGNIIRLLQGSEPKVGKKKV